MMILSFIGRLLISKFLLQQNMIIDQLIFSTAPFFNFCNIAHSQEAGGHKEMSYILADQ
jgi:hypothetical protein